jgi:hypothetical protein
MPSDLPFLPDDYAMTIMSSLSASCSFRALSHSLEGKPVEERNQIIESIFSAWRTSWRAKFQEDMGMYNDLLASGKVTGAADQLPSPEEYQEQFNRTMKEVEGSARAALFPEEVK